MERDSFGLPIKRSKPLRPSSERVTPIRLNESPRILSLPLKKAINPFVDPIPPKPRNPFDDELEESDKKLSDIFSSNHSYKQLSTHGIPPEAHTSFPTKETDLEMNEEVEEDEEEDGNNPLPYRLSQERQSSRRSYGKIILKAERSMMKRGYGEEIVAVDKTDENAVIRFLLSQRSISSPFHDFDLISVSLFQLLATLALMEHFLKIILILFVISTLSLA
jgi:hypothetical protein